MCWSALEARGGWQPRGGGDGGRGGTAASWASNPGLRPGAASGWVGLERCQLETPGWMIMNVRLP